MDSEVGAGSDRPGFTMRECRRGGYIAYLERQPRIGVMAADEAAAREKLNAAVLLWTALLDADEAD